MELSAMLSELDLIDIHTERRDNVGAHKSVFTVSDFLSCFVWIQELLNS